jgi:hypothetical protein
VSHAGVEIVASVDGCKERNDGAATEDDVLRVCFRVVLHVGNAEPDGDGAGAGWRSGGVGRRCGHECAVVQCCEEQTG